MKLTFFFLTVTFLQVQATGFSQNVSLHLRNASLKQLFGEIEKQTSYLVLAEKSLLDNARKVDIQVDHASLKDVLEICFKDQPLTYAIEDGRYIVIQPKIERKIIVLPSVKKPDNPVKGRVTDSTGTPLMGVSISVRGKKGGTFTDAAGMFNLNVDEGDVLQISFVGHDPYAVTITRSVLRNGMLAITLKPVVTELDDVTVSVNTGYQRIPKERATGSFVTVDNKQLNRRVSVNILSRLEGIASGLAFYRNSKTDQPTLNIRGRSTIYANALPLIILDNFPYDGDINNINPNDVESVTILRDAGAASVYGVRAANGVLVITTKKGSVNQAPQVNFNTNVTVSGKPDLGYLPRLSAPDFIESEKLFFSRGWYATQEASAFQTPLTPVVELLIKKRDGLIAPEEADRQIEAFKQNNVLNEFEDIFLRRNTVLQNALSITGGGKNSRYLFSVGYDKDNSSFVRNGYDRYSVTASNSFTPVRNLDITAALNYTYSRSTSNNPGISEFMSFFGRKYYPYARLTDENGNALPVTFFYRETYKALKESQGFLDWQNRPVDEMNLADNTAAQNYNRFNVEIRKTFTRSFNIELKYQYEKQLRKTDNLMSQETYFTRNLINQYYNPTGTVKYPIPVGDILDQSFSELEGHTGRAQANFNRSWHLHAVNLLGGFEVKQLQTKGGQSRLYGYSDDIIISQPIDYVTRFPTNPAGNPQVIPYPRTVTNLMDRFLSYYANGAYTFDNRYTVSASARIDNTNYFGVKSNQRIVPLWSTGIKWNLAREKFFRQRLFDQLTFRATYGYNGNVNKDLTAYTTIRYGTDYATPDGNATVVNPPNPELKWEKVSMLNLGIDFALMQNSFSGSIEYFVKKGKDIIGDMVMDPTTGITSFRGNLSNMQGQGIDVQLTARASVRGITWSPTLLISYATDKALNYTKTFVAGALIQQGSGDLSSSLAPYNGHPVLSIYSYAWGGLDPTNGNPLGYVNGQRSSAYSDILTKTTAAEVVYNGPVNPPVFGGFRNDLSWKRFSLSFNITYKFGHYFRRPSVDYGQMLTYWYGHEDYLNRWQKPGDEQFTNVPSIPSQVPGSMSSRDYNFYANTSILVEKADHIRLQDIVLSYDLERVKGAKLPFRNAHLYCYLNNLGILWRANAYGIDPDAIPNGDMKFLPQPRSISLGAKFDF